MDDWYPELPAQGGPKYLAIADAIEAAMRRGDLRAGTRLPTHRGLARRLDLTVGTVTRAYAEAEKRGLVRGEVGRGTFVADLNELVVGEANPEPEPIDGEGEIAERKARAVSTVADRPPAERALWPRLADEAAVGYPIDLASDTPVTGFSDAEFAASLRSYLESGRFRSMIAGEAGQSRASGAASLSAWHAELGILDDRRRILPTHGGAGAVAALLHALVPAGSPVMVEALAPPRLRAAIEAVRCHSIPVQMDEEGLIPESLELACWSRNARILVCAPVLQAPTTATMSQGRREEVAQSAARFDVTIVEIEGASRLLETPVTRLAALAPERTVHVGSLADLLAPWLAVGYLAVPGRLADEVEAALGAFAVSAPPIDLGIAAAWIEDRFAQSLLSLQRTEARWRRQYACSVLNPLPLDIRANGLSIWATLADGARSPATVIAARALELGVSVSTGAGFEGRTGRPMEALRLSLGACGSPARLREALDIVARAVAEA